MSSQPQDSLPQFDRLWNYQDPAGTEIAFREILPQAEASGLADYHAQLLTQIARTYSLRGKFEECHALLDNAERLIEHASSGSCDVARVRVLLERGRAFNSAGQPERALPLFEKAQEVGEKASATRHAIDAVHMIAIVQSDPQEQISWNLKGIALAQTDEKQRGWLHAFYNNIGESYLLAKDFENAYKYFHKLSDLQREKGEASVYTIKDEAKALRLMGKAEESLGLIEPIARKLAAGNEDGWILEEFAESLAAVGRTEEAKPIFGQAYELLSKDAYCIQHEAAKLERLKKLSAR